MSMTAPDIDFLRMSAMFGANVPEPAKNPTFWHTLNPLLRGLG